MRDQKDQTVHSSSVEHACSTILPPRLKVTVCGRCTSLRGQGSIAQGTRSSESWNRCQSCMIRKHSCGASSSRNNRTRERLSKHNLCQSHKCVYGMSQIHVCIVASVFDSLVDSCCAVSFVSFWNLVEAVQDLAESSQSLKRSSVPS